MSDIPSGALDAGESRAVSLLARVILPRPGEPLDVRKLYLDEDPTNARRAALAQSLSLKSAQPRYEAVLARAPSLIADLARQRSGPALAQALSLGEGATILASSARHLSLDPQSTVFELAGMLAALAPSEGRRAA